MHLITRMVAERSERPSNAQIKLVAERRLFLKRRWRGAAEDGEEFGFDLESRLIHGAVIYQTESADYVIEQEPELVIEVPIDSAEEAALIGWKIGNLHFPVQILADVIRVTHDPAITQLIEREGWPHREATVCFNPLKAVPHAS